MATVFLSIGSNLGSRLSNCLAALALLEKEGIRVTKLSPWYLSEPLGLPQPWFVNGAVWVYTTLSPATLLTRLQEIEEYMGRKGKGSGGPRTIDLDIILYGEWILDTPWLTLPHPRFRERRFVLEPLARIAPWVRDPITGLTMQELLEECPDPSRIIPLKTGMPWGKTLGSASGEFPQKLPQAFWHRL